MRHGTIYKTACFLKNTFQVLCSAISGWVLAWWFLYSAAFITDKPDRAEEAADIKILGYFMLLSGIIAITTKEIVMYRINKDWKRYILFSIMPLFITAAASFYYIIFYRQL